MQLVMQAHEVDERVVRRFLEQELVQGDVPIADRFEQGLLEDDLSSQLPDLEQVRLVIVQSEDLLVFDFQKKTAIGRILGMMAARHNLIQLVQLDLELNFFEIVLRMLDIVDRLFASCFILISSSNLRRSASSASPIADSARRAVSSF